MSTPLIIKLDFEEDKIEDGVYAISIVDSPAIEVDFFTFNKYEFATYSDYPKAVSAAAERGIRLNEAINNKVTPDISLFVAIRKQNSHIINIASSSNIYLFIKCNLIVCLLYFLTA